MATNMMKAEETKKAGEERARMANVSANVSRLQKRIKDEEKAVDSTKKAIQTLDTMMNRLSGSLELERKQQFLAKKEESLAALRAEREHEIAKMATSGADEEPQEAHLSAGTNATASMDQGLKMRGTRDYRMADFVQVVQRTFENNGELAVAAAQGAQGVATFAGLPAAAAAAGTTASILQALVNASANLRSKNDATSPRDASAGETK